MPASATPAATLLATPGGGSAASATTADRPSLRRVISFPLLVFYGLGVTVGAGIFALIGQILGIAGDFSPFVFLMAALLAAVSAGSYAFLSRRSARAAGAAAFAEAAFGPGIARVTGIGVALTGLVSASVIALAFGGYVATIVGLPDWTLALGLIAVLTLVACAGVRLSIVLAAIITVIEVGTLVVVIVAGLPELSSGELWGRVATLPGNLAQAGAVLAASTIAFYAFIGFEDMVNMAEETKRPERVMAPAMVLTLVLTTILYVAIAAVAVSVSDRAPIAGSAAPMGDLFAALTGGSPTAIVAIAAVAMLNGVLIQILMASRVLYGMAGQGLLRLRWLGVVNAARGTPINATLVVALLIGVLVAILPIVRLAELTSYITLLVFTVVNLGVWRIASRAGAGRSRFWTVWGLVAALLTAGTLVADLLRQFGVLVV